MSKKKNTLLRNTSILMAATIISRVIGLLYLSLIHISEPTRPY